jgi:hypothetical protein
MIPKAGDIFKYKMTAQTKQDEESDAEDFPEEDSDQIITYYYTEEVFTVNKNIVTYKIIFDSIMVSYNSKVNNQLLNANFSSNVQDSFYYKADFIQYISVINESFYIKVTTKGKIEEVYGLEKVYEKMFKAFGDTLTEFDKSIIKESFGNDAIKSVLQQQFQILPEKEISIADLNWHRSYDTDILYFPAKNNLNYKIVDAIKENEDVIITINALLSTDILKKTAREEDVEYKMEQFNQEGEGVININLNRGCVIKKETATSIQVILKMQSGGVSMKSKQIVETHMKVELLE